MPICPLTNSRWACAAFPAALLRSSMRTRCAVMFIDLKVKQRPLKGLLEESKRCFANDKSRNALMILSGWSFWNSWNHSLNKGECCIKLDVEALPPTNAVYTSFERSSANHGRFTTLRLACARSRFTYLKFGSNGRTDSEDGFQVGAWWPAKSSSAAASVFQT